MARYILPSEVRPFEQAFYKLQSVTGDDSVTLFEAFLDFFINGFDIERKPIKDWKYNVEQNKIFFELFQTYVQIFDKRVSKGGRYDMFGDFFMAIISNSSKQYRGQFFTPEHICDLMVRCTIGGENEGGRELFAGIFGNRHVVNDPTCGSGRLLLAAHNVYCENNQRGRYFVGEDIDRLCVKMTAVNLCMHGCFGEVVQHDTLCNPEGVNLGYIVNEGLILYGVPSIRRCDDPMQFVSTRRSMAMKAEQSVEQPAVVETPKKKDRQLSFFDMEGFV